MMEQRLTYITLGVKNLKRASDFYEQKFGWIRSEQSVGDVVFYKLNQIILALFPAKDLAKDATVPAAGSGFKRFSLSYNVRSEQEVDSLVAELRAKKVKVVKKPQKAEWGGYTAYVADPDNNLWEIAYNPFLKLDELGNPE